jgi:hypothetical protein
MGKELDQMDKVKQFGRSLVALVAAALVCLVVFGLVLALLWLPSSPSHTAYRLVAVFLAGGIAFAAGGFAACLIASGRGLAHGVIFGFVSGILTFSYLLGASRPVVLYSCASGLLAGIGAWVAQSIVARRAGQPLPAP